MIRLAPGSHSARKRPSHHRTTAAQASHQLAPAAFRTLAPIAPGIYRMPVLVRALVRCALHLNPPQLIGFLGRGRALASLEAPTGK